MQPIVYTSKDPSAPQASTDEGAINTIIKACLVTGYGDKPSADWELVYEDLAAKQIALRSKSLKSLKSVFLLTNNVASRGIGIHGFLGWDAQDNIGVNHFYSGNGIDRAVVGWVIIANDRFCWIWTTTDAGSTIGVIQAFGDAKSLDPLKNYSVILSYTSTQYTHQNLAVNSIGTSNTPAVCARPPFEPLYNSSLGDESKNSNMHRSVNINVFSSHLLYMKNADEKWIPSLFLPGLLMTWTTIPYRGAVNGVSVIKNQSGFVNPICLFRQDFHGHIPIHTDSWD